MSDEQKTTETTAPQSGTVSTPQAEPPALTVSDLRNIRTILDVSTQRGAFRGAELKTIGEVYDKLNNFLIATDEKAGQSADAPAVKSEGDKS
tara:strand:+ start:32 stop:307 length:276 start_codon:yes stop_codon:yes gene_type:complete